MSGVEFGFLMFGAMLVLLAIRVPIGIAMLLTGVTGYVTLTGWAPLLNYLKTVAYSRFSVYDLSVIPMFLLMGQLASRGGLSQSLFNAANAVIGHWRGGVAMAAVGACAGFGAICGSSLATAATMGQVALPELRRLRYEPALATGTLAAGGTLGILIPPSIVLVVYAILAEQNIAKLFMAAFVPGIIAALGYMIAIGVYVRVKPGTGPAGERHTWRQRIAALREVWPVVLLFVVVIGGIYGGIFTPTEAASVGTAGALFFAVWLGGMRWDGMLECIYGTAEATGMIFLILLGADVLNVFLALTQMPSELAQWVGKSGLSPLLVLGAIIGHLRRAGLPDGQPVDDPADDPDLLPDRHGPRLFGPQPDRQGDLVRHPRADGRRDRPHHPARRHERLHHQQPGARRADGGDVQGRRPVPHFRCDSRDAARLLPDPLAVARPHVDVRGDTAAAGAASGFSAAGRPRPGGRS